MGGPTWGPVPIAEQELLLLAWVGPWDSPDMNTEVSCHALLQVILPTQGLNPGLPQADSLQLSQWESLVLGLGWHRSPYFLG